MRVYKRGKSWYLDINFEGRRIRKKIKGARTKTEAHAALTSVKADLLRGEFNFKQEKRILFEDFCNLYLERHSKPNKRSWRRDVTSIKSLKAHFNGIPISKITTFQIDGYKQKRKKQVEVSTVNREIALMKHFYTKAVEWGYASYNPAGNVKLYSEVDRKRWRILSQDEISLLLSNSTSPLKETILIALNTGMRIGEIQSLKWKDIDIQNEFISIKYSKSGPRKVPLNGISKRALLKLREQNGNSDYVFYNPKTNSYIKYPRKSFQTACKKSGIYSLRFHDLRHHAATVMVQSGIDLHTVSKILGHSDIKLTMRYSHPGFDHTKSAVKVLEKMVSDEEESKKKSGTKMAQELNSELIN